MSLYAGVFAILFMFMTPDSHAQIRDGGVQTILANADSLFIKGEYHDAVEEYKPLLVSPGLIPEYRSLILLRIAYTQKAGGMNADCKATLAEIRALDYIPEHHRLDVAALEDELAGKDSRPLDRTPYPSFDTTAATLHVSMAADAGQANGSRQHPYRTIRAALMKVRDLRKQGGLSEGAVVVALLDSVMQVDEPIVLSNDDSGTERNPLVIRAAVPGMRSRLEGGVVLSRWKKEADSAVLDKLPESSRGKVLVCSLPENGVPHIDELVFGGFSSARARGSHARFGTMPVPELFFDGVAQVMARWPNEGDTDIPLEGFTDDRPLRWTDESDLWLHGYWYWQWADAYEKVDRISREDRTIHIAPPVNRYGFRDSKWHAVNALAELDVPGEWHLDTGTQAIHYLPPDGFDPSRCVLSVYGPLVQATDCDNLALERIDLKYVRGDGMIFEECDDLTLADCRIRAASGTGLRIRGGLNHLIHTVDISYMGRGGIDILAGDWISLVQSGDIIENCRISVLSRIDRTYTPALLLDGMGYKVRYCLFRNIPSSAIRCEASESIIELNEFTNCVSESDDQGAIDVWGNPLYRGNVFRWNYFHDILGRHGMVAGIRLDDAISGFMIAENVFIRSSGGVFGGVQIHGGKDSYVEGNIFADCNTMVSNSPWGQDRWHDTVTTKDGVILNNLKRVDWQSEEWMRRYPMLRHLIDGPSDRNFLADNLGLNVEKLHIRFSDNMASLNDRQGVAPSPVSLGDVREYLVPWHPIPLDSIGPY